MRFLYRICRANKSLRFPIAPLTLSTFEVLNSIYSIFPTTRSQSWGSKAAFVSIFLPSRPSQVYHFFLIISPNLKTLEISFFLNWFCRLEPNLVFKSRNWLQSKIFQNKDYDMMKPCWIQNEKSSGLGSSKWYLSGEINWQICGNQVYLVIKMHRWFERIIVKKVLENYTWIQIRGL